MTQMNLDDACDQNQDRLAVSFEYAYGEALRLQWASDQRAIQEQGRIPDWIGEPHPLSKDKARLLELLYECGYIIIPTSMGERHRKTIRAMGLQCITNAKYVIDACVKEVLAEYQIYDGDQVVVMTRDGEYALDEYNLDKELGVL